jgi:adenosine deaminase
MIADQKFEDYCSCGAGICLETDDLAVMEFVSNRWIERHHGAGHDGITRDEWAALTGNDVESEATDAA